VVNPRLKGIAMRWRTAALVTLVAVALLLGYELIAVRGTFVRVRPATDAGGTAFVLGMPGHRIAGRVYQSGTAYPGSPMVIVLHGDAPYVKPGYQYLFASTLAHAVPGTRVVAMLRPGYTDPYGLKSDGDRGFAVGENYTRTVVDDIAAAIELARSQWGASQIILVGHSGGAALAANIAALHSGLVQHVFLVGCPCDVPSFSHHMARQQWGPLWLFPTSSLSPIETLKQMRPSTSITAISGSRDEIALPEYAQSYIAKAKQAGITASMIVLEEKGHEILNDPAVIQQVATAVSSVR
jgi:predicted esterase